MAFNKNRRYNMVADEVQVLNTDNWLKKMNVRVCDTGNSMTDKEIIDLSSKINMQELRKYRITVGRKTREVIQRFQPSDLKRTMEPARLQRILDGGAVLNVDGANWLIDFWRRKNVAGILLMPITRHHIVHINELESQIIWGLRINKRTFRIFHNGMSWNKQ